MNELTISPFVHSANGVVSVPGSKSITNRALLMAALSQGNSQVKEALESEDTVIFSESLRRLGFEVEHDVKARTFRVSPATAPLLEGADTTELWVGNAGTAARFLLPLAIMSKGQVRFDGVPAMRQRPMMDLLRVVESQGASIHFEGETGYFPLTISGNGFKGGTISLEATKSSQQVSALMMMAPLADIDTVLELTGTVVSQPYIDLTAAMMKEWGVTITRTSGTELIIPANASYVSRDYVVEPDASSASYFFAAAAVTGGTVGVRNLSRDALQGDVLFVDVLEQMGCTVTEQDATLFVTGPKKLRGVTVDMDAISDTAPTLAAIASNADSPVTIKNVEHMRWKETDRVEAMANEIRRCGGRVDTFSDGLTIYPAKLSCASVHTYEDHRIAMAMAIAGIANDGVVIQDPGCVGKTFATFFEVLEDLRRQSFEP